eukprot:TRINITY_DN4601_c0_g1_i2.p1 TRINITY_DN4601_c0_g1~~TRINITY_DN4601_c0_g1_i2.p1  ORF type:complete len:367 (-),score=68.66 TRINITY_DN4601_c0_g1_i2:33-1133(-)
MRLRAKILVLIAVFSIGIYFLLSIFHLEPPKTKLSLKNPVDIRSARQVIEQQTLEDLEDVRGIRNLERINKNVDTRENTNNDSVTFGDNKQERAPQEEERRKEEEEEDLNNDVYNDSDDVLTDEEEESKTNQLLPSQNVVQPIPKRAEIAIITIYDNETQTPGAIGGRYLDILNMSLTNKQTYAKRHGYDFHVDLHMWIDKDRPVAWSKLLAIRKRLDEYKWVMWVDVDTLFMNFNIKLESLIDENYDFIVTNDGSGLNSGVMLFRQSQWAKDFLLECYQQTQFLIHKDIYEQRSIQHLVNTNPENGKHIKYLPQSSMNSYTRYHAAHYAYKEGEFMVHMAGCRFLPNCKPYFYETYKSYYDMPKG